MCGGANFLNDEIECICKINILTSKSTNGWKLIYVWEWVEYKFYSVNDFI